MKKSYLSRKENIVLTAIDIVDSLGWTGLTIREIAAREGVTEAAIYRHFKSKEEIIMAVVDKFACFDCMIENTITAQNFTTREAIVFFVNSYVEYYENYPAITAMLFTYDALRQEGEAMQKIIDIMNERYDFLKRLIEQGVRKGEVKESVNAENLVYIIFGTVNSITQMWRAKNCGFSLKDKIMTALDTLLGFISP